MTVKYILENIFGKDINWHCKNLNNKAMIKFNAASPFQPFAEPIIDIKEMMVDTRYLFNTHRDYKADKIKIVCLINSCEEGDQNQWMSVKDVIEKLKQFDEDLDLCNVDKQYVDGWIPAIINVYDEDPEYAYECDKKNIPNNFIGEITFFFS